MQVHSDTPRTLEDLYRLPADDSHHELVLGRLVSEPPAGARHGRIAMRIGSLLDAYAWEHESGVVLTCDTSFVLARDPDTVRAPDVAYVTRERYLALEDESRPIPGPPDLAVEVLSPRDRATDIDVKVCDYLAAGATLVWVIDPQARRVRTYGCALQPVILDETGVLTAEELLPDFSLPVADLFRTAF